MAKYLIRAPAFVNGDYTYADIRNPVVLDLPDDIEPSVNWEPLDSVAKSNLEKLAKAKGIKKKFEVTAVEPKEETSDFVSMADIQTAKPKRASDKDAI